jgi:hypothetical protein
MYNLVLSSGSTTTNTHSEPFYDYGSDTLWVGNDNGVLFEVTNVFNSATTAPAKAAGSWAPGVAVSTGTALTGPLLDYFSGNNNILVANTAGVVYSVSSTGTVSGTHYTVTGAAAGVITDPIIEDGGDGEVYIFSGGSSAVPYVTQVLDTLASASAKVATVGPGGTGNSQIHAGFFSNNYWTSPSTGLLYVCGEGSGSGNIGPALYAIGFNSGGTMVAGTPTNGPLELTTTATTAGQCSPLAEVYNTNQNSGTDWLFAGVTANCAFGGNSGGCVMSFQITSGFPAGAYATGAESGGTSGIIVDNVSTSAQASSLYFTTLTTPGAGLCGAASGGTEPSGDSTACLVKRTQAGLQ